MSSNPMTTDEIFAVRELMAILKAGNWRRDEARKRGFVRNLAAGLDRTRPTITTRQRHQLWLMVTRHRGYVTQEAYVSSRLHFWQRDGREVDDDVIGDWREIHRRAVAKAQGAEVRS